MNIKFWVSQYLACKILKPCSALTLTLAHSLMQVGSSYYVRVRAMNAAGIEGYDDSQPIKIAEQSQSLSPQQVAGIVLGAVIGTGILVAALAIYLTRIWCAPSYTEQAEPCPACCLHVCIIFLAIYLAQSMHYCNIT